MLGLTLGWIGSLPWAEDMRKRKHVPTLRFEPQNLQRLFQGRTGTADRLWQRPEGAS
jgi:hypothetical protein